MYKHTLFVYNHTPTIIHTPTHQILKYMPKQSEEECAQSFRAALLDLTFNSKPIITGLTVKASENVVYAGSIVQVITEHFTTVLYSFLVLTIFEN